MNLIAFLQSIVSIAFIYLVLSLFTSEIQEYLAAIFESRPKRLKQSIRQMLGEQDYPLLPLKVDRDITSDSKTSRIWIDPNGVIKKVENESAVIENNNHNSESIFIKYLEAEKYEEVSQQVNTKDVLSLGNYYYGKGTPVIRYPIHTLLETVEANGKVWEKNGELSVIGQGDTNNIDNNDIWINDQDNSIVNKDQVDSTKTVENKSTTKDASIPVTKYPVFTNSGTQPINSGTKVSLNQGKIKAVSIPEGKDSIYIINEVGLEVKETEVEEVPDNSGHFHTKGEFIFIKTLVHNTQQIIDRKNKDYFLDTVNKTLVDQVGNVVLKPIKDISQFGSLTEKLYSHRNIQALNQSGFAWLSSFIAWLSLFNSHRNIQFNKHRNIQALNQSGFAWLSLLISKNWQITSLAWTFLISIIAVVVSVFYKQFFIYPIWILCFWTLILGVLSYLLNQSKGDLKTKARGRNRISVGPSYISADIFANTLVDVLLDNTMEVKDQTKRLSTLFYTPAKPVLGQWLKELQTENPGVDLKPKELVGELSKKYEAAFDKVQERSSGVYKRNAKGLSFLLGLLLAILLNADTLNFVNKFTQADNKSNTDVFEFVNKQQIKIPECDLAPDSVACLQKKSAAFKAFREEFVKLNGNSKLPLGWNTDTIQELKKEIDLLEGNENANEETIKKACDPNGGDATCLDRINKLVQNNPDHKQLITEEFRSNLANANASLANVNSITQKYQDLKNKYLAMVKEKTLEINKMLINGKVVDQKLKGELEALKKLDDCKDENNNVKVKGGKECFDGIVKRLQENDPSTPNLIKIIENDQDFKNTLQEVNEIEINKVNDINNQKNIANLENLKKEYTQIISQKEKELQQLVQAQAPTLEQVNIAVKRQGGWLKVPFGWLITAIAISMGAPFWFDLIGRIMNVRNTNKEGNTTEISQKSTSFKPLQEGAIKSTK